MKKSFLKYIPLFLGLALTFSACSDDDADDLNDNPTVPKPTMIVSVNGTVGEATYEVLKGDSVTISLTAYTAAGGGKDLDVISLTQTGVNATNSLKMMSSNSNEFDFSTATEQNIKNADDEKLILSSTFGNITSNTGSTTYEFMVKDKSGLVVKKSFEIIVTTATPFTTTENGEIWHILGLKKGSWSLTGDSAVSAKDSKIAEIVNIDDANTGFTGSYKVGSSRANTTFVKANASFDYATASREEAVLAYAIGNAMTQTATAPAKDDVYIYNLDNGNLAIVKITAIDKNAPCGAGCGNTGKMTFEYKK